MLGAVAALALPAGAAAAPSPKLPPQVRLWGPATTGPARDAADATAPVGAAPRVAFGLGDAVAVGGSLSDLVARYSRRAAAREARREARAQERREARRQRQAERFARLPGGVAMATLEAIAACESGGDPEAVSSGGTYRGMFQFDQGTWESVGGHGDPAAAPAAEQEYRAALLYARSGSSPWPVCG